ncbi:MAG: hypothetical protein GPJ21_23265, partial [Microcystis aeruginosa W13-11]|nr:hypothetical protein [Microcystis aeruginosa W13-11]
MEAHQPNNIGKIIGGVLMAKSRSYQDDLFKALQDTEEARAYLNAALEDGNAQVFILALQPTFRTLSCHREKLRREKIKVSIKINIRSEKRHLRNS